MSKGKKKVRKPVVEATVKSQKHGRLVTTKYHKLTAQLDLAKRSSDEAQVTLIEEQLVVLGGVEAYQQASQVSTAHNQTSKWVVLTLRKRGLTKPSSSGIPPMRVLEIGAINTQETLIRPFLNLS